MRKNVLILGASGRFGRHAAEAFWNAGWCIHTFDRRTDDLMQKAHGMDVIVAGWNPPYSDWAAQLLPLHAQIQAAARAHGATVIVPCNVYVYAPDASLPWGPDTRHAPKTPLGRLRTEMEESYRRSGVRTIFLRAGDFIDDQPSESWLDKVILKDMARGRVTYPGRPDVAHAWAWLPDLARVAVMMADRRIDLDPVEEVTFPGYTLTGEAFAGALAAATGLEMQIREMAWWPLRLMRPVWPMARHLLELRYLWDVPHRLDGGKLAQLCPDFRETPLEEALLQMARGALRKDIRDLRRRPLRRARLKLS